MWIFGHFKKISCKHCHLKKSPKDISIQRKSELKKNITVDRTIFLLWNQYYQHQLEFIAMSQDIVKDYGKNL